MKLKLTERRTTNQQYSYDLAATENVNCPLCNNNEHERIAIEWGVLGIVRCKVCRLIYVNPRLRSPEQRYCCPKEQYLQEAQLVFTGKQKNCRDANYLDDLKRIQKYKPKGNFLDIGTNMGMFLRQARERGWQLFGIEPSPTLSEIAREKFHLNVFTGFLHENKFADDFFDVITLTDVFEHITEPHRLLRDIHRIIKPDGLLFIKVPSANFNLLKYWLYKKVWHRFSDTEDIFRDIFDSREHIAHYTEKTLTKILDENGFRVNAVEIGRPIHTPTWRSLVGAFYVYPTPWCVDLKNKLLRWVLYCLAMIAYYLTGGKITALASNIIIFAQKKHKEHKR